MCCQVEDTKEGSFKKMEGGGESKKITWILSLLKVLTSLRRVCINTQSVSYSDKFKVHQG